MPGAQALRGQGMRLVHPRGPVALPWSRWRRLPVIAGAAAAYAAGPGSAGPSSTLARQFGSCGSCAPGCPDVSRAAGRAGAGESARQRMAGCTASPCPHSGAGRACAPHLRYVFARAAVSRLLAPQWATRTRPPLRSPPPPASRRPGSTPSASAAFHGHAHAPGRRTWGACRRKGEVGWCRVQHQAISAAAPCNTDSHLPDGTGARVMTDETWAKESARAWHAHLCHHCRSPRGATPCAQCHLCPVPRASYIRSTTLTPTKSMPCWSTWAVAAQSQRRKRSCGPLPRTGHAP